jgi:hypothetical protein
MTIIISISTLEKVSSVADRHVGYSLALLTKLTKQGKYIGLYKLFIKINFLNIAPSLVNMASH